MSRIFVYDDREHSDPDPKMSVDEVRQYMTAFFPELATAETSGPAKRPNKDTPASQDDIYTFKRRTGTKGADRMQPLKPAPAGIGVSGRGAIHQIGGMRPDTVERIARLEMRLMENPHVRPLLEKHGIYYGSTGQHRIMIRCRQCAPNSCSCPGGLRERDSDYLIEAYDDPEIGKLFDEEGLQVVGGHRNPPDQHKNFGCFGARGLEPDTDWFNAWPELTPEEREAVEAANRRERDAEQAAWDSKPHQRTWTNFGGKTYEGLDDRFPPEVHGTHVIYNSHEAAEAKRMETEAARKERQALDATLRRGWAIGRDTGATIPVEVRELRDKTHFVRIGWELDGYVEVPVLYASQDAAWAAILAVQRHCHHVWRAVSHEERACSHCGAIDFIPDLRGYGDA